VRLALGEIGHAELREGASLRGVLKNPQGLDFRVIRMQTAKRSLKSGELSWQ